MFFCFRMSGLMTATFLSAGVIFVVPKFLFCVFTAGLSANFVACAAPACSEVENCAARLDLPPGAEKASEKSEKNFLPFDFKNSLKNIGPLVKKNFW